MIIAAIDEKSGKLISKASYIKISDKEVKGKDTRIDFILHEDGSLELWEID